MTTDTDALSPLGHRERVDYPGWLKVVCLAIFLAQAAKVPSLNEFVLARAASRPDLGEGISTELFQSAVYAGIGVLLLFSAVIGCIILYSTAKLLHRRARDKSASFRGDAAGILYSLAFALLWPDLWAGTGIVQPLAEPLYWASHLAVVLVVAHLTRRDRRWYVHAGLCFGVSLLGALV